VVPRMDRTGTMFSPSIRGSTSLRFLAPS
jgi:hypothetical protein